MPNRQIYGDIYSKNYTVNDRPKKPEDYFTVVTPNENKQITKVVEGNAITGTPHTEATTEVKNTTENRGNSFFVVGEGDKEVPLKTDKIPSASNPAPEAPKEETTTPEYQKYLDMQKEYIEKYLGRDEFSYDVNADELYNIYRKQAIDTAEKARRDTVAQAAGLTGGYGSSYATQLGTAAYNDIMKDTEAMIPELYDAALSKYKSEGEALLDKAQIAGNYADMLKSAEDGEITADDILAMLGGGTLGGTTTGTTSDNYEAAQKVRTAQSKFDPWGENKNGATIYDEAMRIFAGVGTNKNYTVGADKLGEMVNMPESEIRNELMTWETKDGERLSKDEVDYLISEISNARLINYYESLTDSSGVSLVSFLEQLQKSGLDGMAAYEKLKGWKDKSGATLSDEDILTLMAYI